MAHLLLIRKLQREIGSRRASNTVRQGAKTEHLLTWFLPLFLLFTRLYLLA